MGIPIVIGVTGHRDVRERDVPRLREVVREELMKLQAACPHSEFILLDSIATGADSLCAQEALSLGMRLVCPLPFDVEEYRKDFVSSPEELETFENLLAQADEVFTAPVQEPVLHERDFSYRQAGIYVATHCHALLALWDGTPPDPGGCGTGEAVSFMLDGSYIGAPPFDAEGDGAVIHIQTPRKRHDRDMEIRTWLVEERPGCLEQTLRYTDVFNEESLKSSEAGRAADAPSTHLGRMKAAYDAADQLSMRFQTRYLRTLWALSLFCVLLVIAFLLYDEAYMNFMLFVWAAAIVAYVVFYRLVLRGKYHQKYIQYRVLAEAMRVQMHLSSLDIRANVSDDFTWTQRHDITWVRKAVDVLLIGPPDPPAATPDQVKREWLDDQRAYHERACKRDGKKQVNSERVTQAMIIGTVIVFLAITALEYGFPGIMDSEVLGLELRAWGKIIWGCLAAVSVFVSGYYGRLSFERKAFDHEKMALLFDAAIRRYDAAPETYERVFRDLAREEIIENGNWMSYCKEDRPTFSL